MRRAQADALEAEAAAGSAAEAVIAAAQVRLLREHPELFVCALLPVTESPIRRGRRLANPEVPTKLALLSVKGAGIAIALNCLHLWNSTDIAPERVDQIVASQRFAAVKGPRRQGNSRSRARIEGSVTPPHPSPLYRW